MAFQKWSEISHRTRGVGTHGDLGGAFGTLADPGGDLVVSEVRRGIPCTIPFHVNVAEIGGSTKLITLLAADDEGRNTYLVLDFYTIEVVSAIAGDFDRLQRKPSGSAVNLTEQLLLNGTNGSIHRIGGLTGNLAMMTNPITPTDSLQMEVILGDLGNHNVEFYGRVVLLPIKGTGII